MRMTKHVRTGLISVATAAMLASGIGMASAAKVPPAPAPGGGGGGKVPPPPVAGGGGGKVPPPPVAGGGGGGGKVPPPPVAGGGGGGGGGGVVLPPPPPPVAGGGGAGALNALLSPTTPLTAVNGLNEDPTLATAPAGAVPQLRFTPARSSLTVTLANMDPARFPLVGCATSVTINGADAGGAIAASVAPNVGNTVSGKIGATSGAGASATVDVVCDFTTPKTGLQHHETHWAGNLP
jgi:hypothetical protein